MTLSLLVAETSVPVSGTTVAVFDNVPVGVDETTVPVTDVRDRAACGQDDRIVDVRARRAVGRIAAGAAGCRGRPARLGVVGGEGIDDRGPIYVARTRVAGHDRVSQRLHRP